MDYQLIIDYNIGRWGYSKQWVRNTLAGYKGKHVDVLISSPGGDLDHALDIRQQFIDHGDVTVHIVGFTASAATVIAMGAKKVCMFRGAVMKVHKCSNYIDVWGAYNADQMEKLIEDLTKNKKENDKIDVILANIYAARCGKKVADILDLLKRDTWLDADEALNYGLVDEIEEGMAPVMLDEATERKLNALGLGTEGIPDGLRVGAHKDSIWEKVKKSLFPAKDTTAKQDSAVDDEQVDESTNPINTTQMKTITLAAAMAAVLAVESLEADDKGRVAISEEQLNAVAKKIDDLSADITAKEISIKDLEKKVADLEKLPGDSSHDVKDDAGEEKLNASDMYNSIKNLI